MITIEKLMEDADFALRKYFTVIKNGVKIEPEIYDHTGEIFMDGEQGVSVWCDIPSGALKFFKGAISAIINVDEDIVCANVFFGDRCVAKECVEDLCDGIDLGSWEVEESEDYLMLTTTFPVAANLAEELSRRFGEFLDERFVEEINELLACFQ
jgi:hypothetical protein